MGLSYFFIKLDGSSFDINPSSDWLVYPLKSMETQRLNTRSNDFHPHVSIMEIDTRVEITRRNLVKIDENIKLFSLNPKFLKKNMGIEQYQIYSSQDLKRGHADGHH